MPDIDPATAEDLRPLGAQDVLRHQDFAIEQEPLLLAVIDDVGADGHFPLPLASAGPGPNVHAGSKRGQFHRGHRMRGTGLRHALLNFSRRAVKHTVSFTPSPSQRSPLMAENPIPVCATAHLPPATEKSSEAGEEFVPVTKSARTF